MASLGLFRPAHHLRHDNFEDMKNRVWRSSFVCPFSSNLAFVLYSFKISFSTSDVSMLNNEAILDAISSTSVPLPKGKHMCAAEHKLLSSSKGAITPDRDMPGTVCGWEELQGWLKEKHLSCDLNTLCC
ncbi:hypothetical protein GWK47_052406 [Chionoecetes opilio]|uniref:Uncharacterized protein n=1 Tax=Chionoecetes opilio TaxID=41210 RepID=A0A8J4Y066_CHIOP|nr:hypothetical protein GWK47_052406 [Chionoecetes opilio]